MAVSLTCGCGARLEIDDKFAGQTVHCPDCQRPLAAPKAAPQAVALRTSGFALTSLILALVGAFTVLGTLAAVVFGIIALVQIGKQSDRLAGKGYAIAGILLGVVMTAGTVFALSRIELFGLAAVINDAQWAGRLDYPVSLEVVREKEGFSIKRPSQSWGIYKPPAITPDDYQSTTAGHLILVQPSDDIVVLCLVERVKAGESLETCRMSALNKLRSGYYDGLFSKNTKGKDVTMGQPLRIKRPPMRADKVEMVEMLVDKKSGTEEKTLLVQVHKKIGDDTMYILVGATRKGNFARVEAQMQEAMDSFKILERQRDP
jgi:hypothetical protein